MRLIKLREFLACGTLAPMQQSLFSSNKTSQDSKQPLFNRKDLNPAQYEAVTTTEGPVLVIAGAGSGKTRTLVYRVAFLLEQGIIPENILLLTFTRKAAQEMLNRASAILDDSCQQVLGGTFHAVANLLLRRHGYKLGYTANFSILDQADAQGIVNLIKSSLNLGGAGKRFPTKRLIINMFSRSVNKNIALENVVLDHYNHLAEYLDEILLIRDHYKKFKIEHGLMDYDDLLVNWKKLLARFPDVREEIANRFQYVLVDEYQDTNPIQAEIVRLIASSHNNVMVVGDDSQSIYSFRGADFRNIMDFPKIFPNTKIIRLEENYRSTQSILAVTNAIIERAEEKYTKTLFSNIAGVDKPRLFAARNEADQARYVVDNIMARHKEGVSYGEMAVLFRSSFHSFKLELELANHQIPFEKRGGQKLTESAHTKDVLAYLRVLANPQDNLSWNRILLQLEKVGPKTAQTILNTIKQNEEPFTALKNYPARNSWKKGVENLADMLLSLQKPGLSPVSLFDLVVEYYRPVFERIYHDDYPRRSRDLDQIRDIINGYASLQAFIDDTALDPPESRGAENLSEAADKLILSTVHSAKGLEWDTVFIIHLAEGKFPAAQSHLPEEQEEERRLLYVAATRAKKELHFIYPREVMSADRLSSLGRISPLLEDIPHDLLRQKNAPRTSFSQPAIQRFKKKVTDGELAAGTTVHHPFFGEGKIEKVLGPRRVDVFFQRHGRKILHLDYAKLEIL